MNIFKVTLLLVYTIFWLTVNKQKKFVNWLMN